MGERALSSSVVLASTHALMLSFGSHLIAMIESQAPVTTVRGNLAFAWSEVMSGKDDAIGKSLEPHERPVGYVFQEASLFSHLS
jgi:hypothetical protein